MKQPDLLSSIPNYIDPDLWADFIQHRKEIRHKLTPTATKFLLRKLETFHQDGIDVNLCITQAIENGWQGIFRIAVQKTKNGQYNGPDQAKQLPRDDFSVMNLGNSIHCSRLDDEPMSDYRIRLAAAL